MLIPSRNWTIRPGKAMPGESIFSRSSNGMLFNIWSLRTVIYQPQGVIFRPAELLRSICYFSSVVLSCSNEQADRIKKNTASVSYMVSAIGNQKSPRAIPMCSPPESFSFSQRFSTGQVGEPDLNAISLEQIPQEKISTKEDKGKKLELNVQSTPDIERKYVHRVYDAIAPHFSSTRFAKWPKVASFLNSLAPGSVILDAGCGNGKYLGFNPDCFYIGCDISAPLINICVGKGHEVIVADAVNLPYRSGFGDAAISIAVLHHLSTEDRRRKAIEELVRVVRRGGLVLITVWAVEQEDQSLLAKWTPLTCKYEEEWVGPGSPRVRSPSAVTLKSIPETEENHPNDHSKNTMDVNHPVLLGGAGDSSSLGCGSTESHQEYFVPWHLPYHRAEVSGASASALMNGLAKKDDKKGAVVYNRYYHVFAEGELERLVSVMENAIIRDQFFDKSNWCVILEKT